MGGKLKYQGFFKKLFLIACHGMNFGEVWNFREDGENLVLKHIRDTIKEPVIFDVGANHGVYSSFALKMFGEKKLNLFSFEPSKTGFGFLKKNVEGRARIFNIGFSDKKRKATLFSEIKGSSLASLYQRNLKEYKIDMDLKEQVSLDTIDNFCSKNKLGGIDFLKIDVEGHELNVMKGAKKMMDSDSIRYIQFETGVNTDSRTFFRDFFYLLTPRYGIYRILKDGFIEIKKYGWENEISVGANYLAVNKKERFKKR